MAAREFRHIDREELWIQDKATYYFCSDFHFCKVLQTDPGSFAAYAYIFDVKTWNLVYKNILYGLLTAGRVTVLNTGSVAGLLRIWATQVTSYEVDAFGMSELSHDYIARSGLPDRKALLHKEYMKLQIPLVIPQEVSAIAASTLEARLPGEGILIGLDNVRKRLSEDAVTAILQGANSFVYPVVCGFARRLLHTGVRYVFSAAGIHRMPAHCSSTYFQYSLGVGCAPGYVASIFHTRILTDQLAVDPGDRIVEVDDIHRNQCYNLLHDPG